MPPFVTWAEYVDGLVKDAMGRLFWSFERAMRTDCVKIILALEGQDEFLRGLFGKRTAPVAEAIQPITQGAFSKLLKKP